MGPMEAQTQEHRKAKRYKLDWPVCVWHEATGKFYNGRSVNISSNGALLRLPLTAPIRMAEGLEVNFPSPEGLAADRYPAKVFTSQVVRVNRPQSILDGQQQVAVRFELS